VGSRSDLTFLPCIDARRNERYFPLLELLAEIRNSINKLFFDSSTLCLAPGTRRRNAVVRFEQLADRSPFALPYTCRQTVKKHLNLLQVFRVSMSVTSNTFTMQPGCLGLEDIRG
jgi:hypothetical protein